MANQNYFFTKCHLRPTLSVTYLREFGREINGDVINRNIKFLSFLIFKKKKGDIFFRKKGKIIKHKDIVVSKPVCTHGV